MSTRILAALLAALLPVGCTRLDTFTCAQSTECGDGGMCEPDGLCSFPDPNCPFGKKYGDYAGALSNQCVEGATGPEPTTTTTVTPTTTTGPQTDTAEPTTAAPTTLTTEAASTTEPAMGDSTTTTGAPQCSGFGLPCDDTFDCCSSCMVCEDGTCVALPPEAGATQCGGPCWTCSSEGQCAPLGSDTACASDCSNIVWKEQPEISPGKTGCLAYPPMPVMGTCDGISGLCDPPDPVAAACPDPTMMPDTAIELAVCDGVCLRNVGLCTQGARADVVTLGNYCALGEQVPGCQNSCNVDVNTNQHSLEQAMCDATGTCQQQIQSCGNYKCDLAEAACESKCMVDSDCALGQCKGAKCQ